MEELRSLVVQRLRPDELFFRKSFRHVNNDSDAGDFSIHLLSESPIHMPGIFIQNLSERPIHIARNPHQQWTFSPGGSTEEVEDYRVTLDDVVVLELAINPDISKSGAHASLFRLRIG